MGELKKSKTIGHFIGAMLLMIMLLAFAFGVVGTFVFIFNIIQGNKITLIQQVSICVMFVIGVAITMYCTRKGD